MQLFTLKQATGKHYYSTHKKLIPSTVCFYGETFSVIHEIYLEQSNQTSILIEILQFYMIELHYHMQQTTTHQLSHF